MSWADRSAGDEPAAAAMRVPTSVVVTVLLITCVAPLNATMIVVALPQVMAGLDAPAAIGSMLVSGYLLVMAALPPLGGRLGDHWGRRPALLAGLATFGLAALGASAAAGFYPLLAWRLLQAAGGAIAFPNALALLRQRVPAQRRGLSFGLVGAVIALSAAAGPLLGQLLIAEGGWRAVFWINVPLVAVALGVSAVTLSASAPLPSRRADLTGRDRLAGLAVLANGRFAAAALAMGSNNLAMYTALVGLPLALAASGMASAGGLLLVALMGTAALAAPAAGRLADVYGRSSVAAGGLFTVAVGLLPLAVFGHRLGLPAIAAGLAVAGVGLGASSTAIQTSGLEAVEAHESGFAAGFLATCRYIGGAAGSSLVPLLLAAAPGEPMRALFTLATAAALLGTLATGRPRLARGLVPRLQTKGAWRIARGGSGHHETWP